MPRARVLLADDHTMVAEALERLLSEDFDLLGSVRDGAALIEAASRLRPDVIVADIAMPGMNGLDAVRELRRQGIPARIVILTMHADPQLAVEALQSGASAYVLKHSAGEELISAVREVLHGRTYVTALLSREAPAGGGEGHSWQPARARGLTVRQRQVLQLIAEGRTMKEIAASLGISTRTVESHKYQMIDALRLRTTADLVRYAIRMGVVPESPGLGSPRVGPLGPDAGA
jgi:DNA-binding NarL/FixJ family response regulator